MNRLIITPVGGEALTIDVPDIGDFPSAVSRQEASWPLVLEDGSTLHINTRHVFAWTVEDAEEEPVSDSETEPEDTRTVDQLKAALDEAKVDALKRDWKQFSELKRSVQLRYQETVDVREFEPKIQKLLDDHVVAMPAETIIEVVNINDPDALKAVVEETGVSEASRADRIASATRRAITEKMDEDPTFYKQFSELLEETIRAYREKRLSEREYLNSVVDLASKVARKDRGRDVPESIRGDEDAQAFFGILDGQLKTKGDEPVAGAEAASIALEIIDIIESHLIVDIWSNEVAQNKLRNAIDDYFFDVLRDERGIDLPVQVLDDLELKIMDLARARFAA